MINNNYAASFRLALTYQTIENIFNTSGIRGNIRNEYDNSFRPLFKENIGMGSLPFASSNKKIADSLLLDVSTKAEAFVVKIEDATTKERGKNVKVALQILRIELLSLAQSLRSF